MGAAMHIGQAGLQGWRERVADLIAPPVAARTALGEDKVRAAVGATFFVLAVVYVAKTIAAFARDRR